ncbi:GTP pyrophosphokinase [Pseudomonas sp.]|uniref:GTP pyrophosphokinase n=1 Tax=Pseudomonas sp. TaxID=306 RepID=UPI003D6E051C
MNSVDLRSWLAETLPKHELLARSVSSIVENLLKSNGIDYLAVTGRVKDYESAVKKIKRKGYKDPVKQLTDLTGIRIIVFFESQVIRVAELIGEAFNVDLENSSIKDASLLVNQMGYRSSHYVCDLGPVRKDLPEYEGLDGLKFEFQVRTVLQHAWAELAHDRNYKFSGKLPPAAERKLFLYAGMLELADRGFDELSSEIDSYIRTVQREVIAGDLKMEITSINLGEFIDEWARVNKFPMEHLDLKEGLGELIEELRLFGIFTLADLNEIIPGDYAGKSNELGVTTTIYGVIRDWMLISDWRRYLANVPLRWALSHNEDILVQTYLPEDEHNAFKEAFRDDEIDGID